MIVTERIIPFKKSGLYKLYLLGDIHLGTVHCSENEVRKKVQEIKDDPSAEWIGMGDYSECITPRDKRWDDSDTVIPNWLEKDNISACLQKRVVDLLN